MKLLKNNTALMVICLSFVMPLTLLIIPPISGSSQHSHSSEYTLAVSLLKKEIIEVNEKSQELENKTRYVIECSNNIQSLYNEIDSMIAIINVKKKALSRNKIIIKRLPPIIIRDTFYIEKEVAYPDVWIFKAPVYGADTIKRSWYKPPGQDGLIPQIRKFLKRKR